MNQVSMVCTTIEYKYIEGLQWLFITNVQPDKFRQAYRMGQSLLKDNKKLYGFQIHLTEGPTCIITHENLI